MTHISRRTFTTGLGAAAALGSLTLNGTAPFAATGKAQVVVIGGGFGGATAAKYLKRFDPKISVILVEPSTQYSTCPFSNTVIGGINKMDYITHNYNALKKMGVTVVHDLVTHIDGAKKSVKLAKGGDISFERCIVSPGIDFRWNRINGLDAGTQNTIPHAWKAGPQTVLLRQQLAAMKDGGTFIISPPQNPFRCPPGPGERISLVANYFKKHKPKSKIVVLDPKKKFSKQGLFKEGWAKLYPGMIDYHNIDNDGVVTRVDVKGKKLITDFGEYKGDVINFIPAQYAGKIARSSGLAEKSGWCPVNQLTFESKLMPGVHVIGDASVASPMPKSGFSASSQAKVCAAAVSNMLKGQGPGTPKFVNTCYSLIAEDYGISVAMVYGFDKGKIIKIKGSGGLSPSGASAEFRSKEADFTRGWYESISKDIWG
ncbi:MAG: FAD-dependent oxidoreductase [Rhodospirillaceae bacterium]|jgi:sulfide dehydrogenase [flavocytochrome c] flavoprotein chain|nr:FAD-dependent oxidoreductase [Rhodospirillaceae bacterium]MBT4587978.1 FAD-dependent oxidoreductase [Rhodospirillaceae bacterium]MBT5938499.1 FAD-dependent oxidoreductase [Rhodospirillaceae bacterium]MBT7268661.1 FAD-dependent oxidoreductase [Rhodospirillaceae bacterium]